MVGLDHRHPRLVAAQRDAVGVADAAHERGRPARLRVVPEQLPGRCAAHRRERRRAHRIVEAAGGVERHRVVGAAREIDRAIARHVEVIRVLERRGRAVGPVHGVGEHLDRAASETHAQQALERVADQCCIIIQHVEPERSARADVQRRLFQIVAAAVHFFGHGPVDVAQPVNHDEIAARSHCDGLRPDDLALEEPLSHVQFLIGCKRAAQLCGNGRAVGPARVQSLAVQWNVEGNNIIEWSWHG
mmetsp:Transcript_31479/g.86603  ORF Transcript_31479/g.86603 Transcript_31479/m.86603 type:complete len:245 (-) Transcript_31479:136-870(-)